MNCSCEFRLLRCSQRIRI